MPMRRTLESGKTVTLALFAESLILDSIEIDVGTIPVSKPGEISKEEELSVGPESSSGQDIHNMDIGGSKRGYWRREVLWRLGRDRRR